MQNTTMHTENPLCEVAFALLQADGYRLLIDVDLKELLELHCPPRLYQLAEWFHQEGDELRSQACRRRIRQVEQTRTCPTSDEPIKCNTPVGR